MQHNSGHSDDILGLLKAATADAHERVEQSLQIFDPGFDLASYARLLERFYGYWEPLERQLCRVEELHHPDLALHLRLKSHLLEADLKVFGIEPGLVSRCALLPRIDNFAKALGCLYVVEGSTLGSQFIARHIRERFQLDSASGAAFFHAYGSEVGVRWTEFRTFLRLHSQTQPTEDLLSAARETFEALESWLVC